MSRSGTKDRGAGSPTHVRVGRESALCGGAPRHLTHDRSMVECKRCLATLAKRDREFRAKARRALSIRKVIARIPGWKQRDVILALERQDSRALAARAIAAEEGR